MRWRWFTGAAMLAAYALYSAGAPMATLVAGIAGAAVWNAWKQRSDAAKL